MGAAEGAHLSFYRSRQYDVCVCVLVCIQYHNTHSANKGQAKVLRSTGSVRVVNFWPRLLAKHSLPPGSLSVPPQKLLSCVWTTRGSAQKKSQIPADSAQSRTASHWCVLTLIEASWYFSMRGYGRCRCADTQGLKWTLFTYSKLPAGRTCVIGWWTGLHSAPSSAHHVGWASDSTTVEQEACFLQAYLTPISINKLYQLLPIIIAETGRWNSRQGWGYPHTTAVLLFRQRKATTYIYVANALAYMPVNTSCLVALLSPLRHRIKGNCEKGMTDSDFQETVKSALRTKSRTRCEAES